MQSLFASEASPLAPETCFYAKIVWRVRVKCKCCEYNPFSLVTRPPSPLTCYVLILHDVWEPNINKMNKILFCDRCDPIHPTHLFFFFQKLHDEWESNLNEMNLTFFVSGSEPTHPTDMLFMKNAWHVTVKPAPKTCFMQILHNMWESNVKEVNPIIFCERNE